MKKRFSKILRIQEWWSFILPPIVLFFYLGIPYKDVLRKEVFTSYILLISLSVCTAITGYFINDLFDMKEDAVANKYNFASTQPIAFRYFFVPFIIFLVGILFYFIIRFTDPSIHFQLTLFISVNLLSFFVYSVPPVRLKSNRYSALILDALYSGTLFYLIAYLISINTQESSSYFLVLIFIWGMLKGIRNYLNHTIQDMEKDAQTGQKTFAVQYGNVAVLKITTYMYPLENLLLCSILMIKVPTLTVLIISLSITFLLLWWSQLKKGTTTIHSNLNDLHEIWYPLILIIFVVYKNPSYFPLLIIHTILFPAYLNKIYFYTIFKLIGPIRKNGDSTK